MVVHLILFGQIVKAQVSAESEILYCNAIGQEDGLLQLNVKCLTQDNLGYLWIGTEDGLLRYNGFEFKAYLHDPEDSTGIPDDHIRGMQFAGGKLWLASNSKGICYFIPDENRFVKLANNSHLLDENTSYRIFVLNGDTLLYSLKNQIIFSDNKETFYRHIQLPESPKECVVNDILQMDGVYWLATTSAGILEINKSDYHFTPKVILANETNNCLLRNYNVVFIGTENGLFFYDISNNTINKTEFSNPVNCFYRLDESTFYIGTDVGLFKYHIPSGIVTPVLLSTLDEEIYEQTDINQIHGDDIGNLWIGTEGDGLFHYNRYQKKFNGVKLRLKEFPFAPNISTFQFLPESDSTVWLGTKYGMVKYNGKTNEFVFYESKERPLIYTLKRDRNNTIWAGGFTSGLLRYNSEYDKFEQVKTNLPDNDVVEIIPLNDGFLWICTWAGGIHKLNTKTLRSEEVFVNGERINRARTSLVDSKGNIWLGTDQGAYCISYGNEVKRYAENEEHDCKLSGERIFSIAEDHDGNIWFGTNVGLTKLDVNTQKTTLYYKQKGLPNDFIYSVLIAANNDVWVSTNFGVSVLRRSTNSFTNFTVSDGLQNNEFNGKAGYADEHGNFYFGGISGFNIFNPEQLVENPYLPKVFIEAVELFNNPVNRNELFTNELTFKSSENVLTFYFTALNYLEPEKCNFQYIMEGFDYDWRPPAKSRSTTYTNLDPGTYTFKVKATNDAGIWSTFTDELKIVIVPPWYATTWFRGIFVFLFLLSGILFYWYKTSMLEREKIRLENIVSHRTKQVQQKNDELQKAFREAESQRDNISFLMKEMRHRINNNLQIISSLLNIQANRVQNPKAVDALQMARSRILAIASVESKILGHSEQVNIGCFIRDISESIINALSNENTVLFKTDYQVLELQLKKINTTLIGLVFNELITNVTKYAFDKYTPHNILTIGCNISDEKLILIVADNGKGYRQNEINAKSMGISLVKSMIDQMNGELKIDTQNGTVNRIEIPL